MRGRDIILAWKAFRGICVKGVNLIHNLEAHSHFCDKNRLCVGRAKIGAYIGNCRCDQDLR